MTQVSQDQSNDGPEFRARLVRMTSSLWSASKRDKKVTREVNEAHGVTNALKAVKSLLVGGAKEYKDLVEARNTARADHYFHTLKWDTGVQLLPTKNTPAYNEAKRRNVAAFADAKAAFLAAYERRQETRQRGRPGRPIQREGLPGAQPDRTPHYAGLREPRHPYQR